MNPISNTAFYCCGVRMEDAARERPVCNDHFASRFMDERGRRIYEPFRSETMANISNAVRCRIVDDMVRAELATDAHTTVVTIGAGFDTRPYRLTGGSWFEIDEPAIIEYKNGRLPIGECPNPVIRIPLEFSTESLGSRLDTIASHGPVVVVVEGVFMYLDQAAAQATLAAISARFPRHILLCDLMNRRFFERFAQGVHAKLMAAGGTFAARPDNPAALVLEHHYVETARVPMFQRAAELGVLWDRVKIPPPMAWLMLHVFARDLNGYAVHRFTRG